jgi:hypothetical protein
VHDTDIVSYMHNEFVCDCLLKIMVVRYLNKINQKSGRKKSKNNMIEMFKEVFDKMDKEKKEAEQVYLENLKFLIWLKEHGMMD